MLERFKRMRAAARWRLDATEAARRKERLLSFGPKALGVLVEGKHGSFIVDPEDGVVSATLLQTGVYSEPELMLARALIPPGGKALVVGAHIGALAVPLSKCCGGLAAIEANPDTFKLLETNLLLNRCSNVAAYNVAASDKPEKIRFLLSRANSGGAKRMPVVMDAAYIGDKPRTVELQAVALDALIDPKDFDLILMDIEGSEYFALKGMQAILGRSKALSVEFLPHHLRNVAHVSVGEFLAPILPHFEWMYVPEADRVVARRDVRATVEAMYKAEESHDGLLFLRNLDKLTPIRPCGSPASDRRLTPSR